MITLTLKRDKKSRQPKILVIGLVAYNRLHLVDSEDEADGAEDLR